ncbi:disulfide bond formation protein DsbD [Neobacillus novalis]|uniref:Disulfide bond formation protein DsbD n=1 Tax=Neobacillus novalis TaxID=220687 RepID=A0AA95SET3_9BACI|nr:disulfide bond formation protein DsbD [Neobacillus novalis]WHY84626.1 disulfide bond formation protein DsbD [Neobacillus novalis]
MAASWIRLGYLDIYVLWLPVTYLCFSISDGSIKNLKKIKKLSRSQSISVVFSFIISVIVVFALIQLANYLINDVLHLQGWIKTLSQIIAVIVALYPVKFTFGSIVYKVNEDLNSKKR